MDLVTIDKQKLDALVAAMPANKRAAFSKAAKAACQHLRDSKANYAKAYDIDQKDFMLSQLIRLEVLV